MTVDLQQTALMAYLGLTDRDGIYPGRVTELRDTIQGWLNYIPHTFPHYTRHTVQHSDEIVLQMSKLLFKEDDPQQPVVRLSAIEAYVLLVSAYLHDAGMVASDAEKAEILASEDWKTWTTDTRGGTKRWRLILELRSGKKPDDEVIRNFLADIQTRHLIAEFVRRTHHTRGRVVITRHEPVLAQFAFDDPVLLRTISDVCVAHGLRQHELEDRETYPDRRDIRGQTVNVRFMAILLRLGDLLDMSHDRACPLLLNAACPLPPESLAHWTQYQRITHCLTAPDRIEMTFECRTQEEHRYLQDWCQWLVNEAQEAGTLMARATRHGDWCPPIARLSEPDSTIVIRPASDATYVPSKWKFELDHDVVFERLIRDVYDHPAAFVRELIQNALDANRCQMYADILGDGFEPPEYPTQVEENRRLRYPVRISLRATEIVNEMSGETEPRQILTVADSGIGMDREIITRYLLQVGRSYYTTDQFRRSYRFVPTSRFGIGFLSVFGVSDIITVETYKRSSPTQDGPLRLTLTGPRNYLLTDRGERRSGGTRIEVLLREPLEQGELTKVVTSWCRKVEFPVIVDDMGIETTVEAERSDEFTYQMPVVGRDDAMFLVRGFPVNRPGIEGELYVFAMVDDRGESWASRSWARFRYPKEDPQAIAPPFPPSLICFHGIAVSPLPSGAQFGRGAASARIDCRSDEYVPALARSRGAFYPGRRKTIPQIESRWEELLREHLAATPRALSLDGWKYKQRLVEYFPLPSFWASLPGMIRVHLEGEARLKSLQELQEASTLVTAVAPWWLRRRESSAESGLQAEGPALAWDTAALTMTSPDLRSLSHEHRASVFADRCPCNARWVSSGHLVIDWTHSAPEGTWTYLSEHTPMTATALPDPTTIGIEVHRTTDSTFGHILLNFAHPLVQWIACVRQTCEQQHHDLKREHFERLMSMLADAVRWAHNIPEFAQYVQGWRALPSLPPEICPPEVDLPRDAFRLRRPNE